MKNFNFTEVEPKSPNLLAALAALEAVGIKLHARAARRAMRAFLLSAKENRPHSGGSTK